LRRDLRTCGRRGGLRGGRPDGDPPARAAGRAAPECGGRGSRSTVRGEWGRGARGMAGRV